MDRLQSLYEALSGKYNLGSFDEFKTKLEDPEKRKALYEFASNDFELGDFDSFSLKIEDSFKKKEDGVSSSQEDTSDFDYGFYNKAQNAAFRDYASTAAKKYQEVIKNDPTISAIVDKADAELIRTRNRILDSYIYDPNFNAQDPQSVARANEDLNAKLQAKYNQIFKEDEEYQSLIAKYDSEFKQDIERELQARLTEESREIADATKEATFTSSVNPLMNIFAQLSQGEGYIPILGDAIAFQIPQAFDGWGLKNDSVQLNKYTKSIDTAKTLDPEAPVYVNAEGELINPEEYGGQMKKDLESGTLPSESPNGTLMTASEAIALLSDKSDVKQAEMKPKWEEAIEMQEFISRINQVKPISEDASFSNIMKTLTQQIPNMGVAMVMPVAGTAILEGGNTYLEQVQEIARERVGDDFTVEDLLDVVESGDDGAAEVTGAAYVSGLLDLVGLGGVGTFVAKGAKAVGKQVLKEAAKQGIKKASKTQLATIGKTIASSGLSEGITEGLQGANMQFSKINTVERATGTRLDFDFQAVLEEGLIGFLMGGIMGGAGGVTTALTKKNKEELPQSVAEVTETEDRTYFDGNEAISRNQATQRVKRATTLKELEKVRVKNDEALTAQIESKKAELEAAAPEGITLSENEEVVSTKEDDKGRTFTYVSETTEKEGVKKTSFTFNRSDKEGTQRSKAFVEPEVAFGDKWEVVEEDIPGRSDGEEDTQVTGVSEIREGEQGAAATVRFSVADESGKVRTFDSSIRLRRKGEAAPEVTPEEVVAEDEEEIVYKEVTLTSDKDAETLAWAANEKFKSVDFMITTPVVVDTGDKVYYQYVDQDSDASINDVKYRLEFKKNKDGSLSRTGVKLVEDTILINPTEEAQVAPEVITAEDKPVEEVRPAKTPEMEELENEIAQIESDIETYEIEAENFQEEIEIEKGNLKEAIADIDARIKEVRASKQSAAAKRDAIEELKAEKQDIKDDNASLIQGYKEDIKNAKREAKKAANRAKRLSTKLEGLAPVQPTAKPVAEQEVEEIEDGAGLYSRFDPVQFIYYTKPRAVGPNATIVQLRPELRRDYPYGSGVVVKESDYTFVLTRSLLTEFQGTRTVEKKFKNREDAIKAYEKEIDRAFELYPNDIYKTKELSEGLNWANRQSEKTPTTKEELIDAIDDVRTKIGEPKVKPTKKVVGTLEVEEDEVTPTISDIQSKSKALAGQLNAKVITAEEYNTAIRELFDEYENKIEVALEETPPIDTITADDSQSDIAAFEAQSPKLKFVKNLLSATKNFRGLFDVQDTPLKVHYFKSKREMSKISSVLDGDESIAGGFMDVFSNRIFIAEDAIPEETAIHEFIHPIAKRIVRNNPELAARLEQEALKDKDIVDFVNQYVEDQQQEEAIVQSIAKAVLEAMKKGRTIPQKIRDFFRKLLRTLGFDTEIVIGDSESNLNDFISNISEAFATGEAIKITEDLQQSELLATVTDVKIKDSNIGSPINRIKFSDRKELTGVKYINPKQFNNKKVLVTAYDNLKTGSVTWKNRITGKSFTFSDKKGGPMHAYLKENQRNNVVAAFTKLNVALKFARQANNAEFLLYSLMSTESSLKANKDIFQDFFGPVLQDISDKFGFEVFKRDLKSILTTKGVEQFKSDLDQMRTPAEVAEYVDNLTFPKRRSIFNAVFPEVKGTPTKDMVMQTKYGLPTAGELYVAYQEEAMNNAIDGDIFGASRIKPVVLVNEKEYNKISKQKIGKEGEMFGVQIKAMPKESEHAAYPFAVEGETVGLFSNMVNARDILPYVPNDAPSAYKYIEGNGPKETETELDTEAQVTELELEGTTEAVVTAAPIRVFPEFFARKYKGKQPTVKDIVAIKNSNIFKSYRKKFIDSAKLFNITVGNITTNIGIWEGALEYSNNLEVKGSPADLKAFAAYMGLVAEPQEATIVSKVKSGGESASINIEYINEKQAQKAVTDILDEGIVGLSYDTDRKIITIFAQDGDKERFQSYYERNQSSIKNVEFYEADVDFISEADYQGILREYRSSEQNQGARRKDLRDAITEVLGESPTGPKGIDGVGVSRMKHSKSTRQNTIRPAQAIQEVFKSRLTPRRVGSMYYSKLGILATVDINELGGLKDPNTGATIGLDLVKEYNKVMPDLIKSVMPLPKQLEPAAELADKIREALDFTTHDKVVEYARILLAAADKDPSRYTTDQEVIDTIRNAFLEFDVQEFTESDLEFIKENISEIRGYASEVYLSGLKNTKFSDRMTGTKYEGREALVKNDIVRSATEILLQQRDELAEAGYKKISVDQLELTDTHMEAIAEKLGGGDEFAKILKSNRKSINNMARNDIRNKNVVAGLIESSRRYFERGIPRKYVQGNIYASEKVLDKILAIIKPKFTETEVKVLEDYMEYSEVRRLFQTIQSLQHGYLPPMAYGIIRKFEAAVKAVELAGKVGNMSIMVDANGRLIKERLAVREARDLTSPSQQLSKSEKDALQKRTTTGAMSFFKKQVDKVIPVLYNQISKAFSTVESQREIDIAKYNEKFAKVRTIANFEGSQYTNSDVNMLGHMYLIEKQYLANPGSNKVPKLYESLIQSITEKEDPQNIRYLELFKDFKLENNTLDIQKVERFLKFMRARTGAAKESGMGIVDFVEKRMRDSRERVRHLQEFQNKTQVEVFDNYIYIATKPKVGSGEVKATMIESLLNTDSASTLGFAKTSVSRQNYRDAKGNLSKLNDREPVFDLMFAANYATNEVLSAYHLGEEFRNVQAQLNILAKMGDSETRVLAIALKDDIRQRIVNTFEYKMDRPTGAGEKFIQKMLSGTYTTYLASARRFVELFSNAVLVSMANPTVARAMVANRKDNIGNATMEETRSIMDKIGSAHRERFNKTGKAFYSAEGIGAEKITGAKQSSSIWDNVKKKDGQFRDSYIAFSEAINKLGELHTKFKNFGDVIVRMSDTKIGAVAWNAVFKERFQELAGVEYSSAMLSDADLFIKNRLAMKEAADYADVFLKESFAGGAFDMNQKALRNKGTMKYLQNMFRTFRTFYYESNRNAIRSLAGLQDGTMSKEEAARRLAGASAASILYAIGTTHLITLFWNQLFLATGLGDEEEDREWSTAAYQAAAEFVLLSSIGKMPAIGYGIISGSVRGTIRYMDKEDLTALEGLNKFVQRLSGSNFLLRQTVPIIGEPVMLGKKTIETALDAAQGEAEAEDAKELFFEALRTAVIYQGIPFSGDIMSAVYTLQRMNEEEKKPKKKKKPKFKSVID